MNIGSKRYIIVIAFILSSIVISGGCAKRVSTSEIGESMKPSVDIGKPPVQVSVTEPPVPAVEGIKESPVKEGLVERPLLMKDVRDVYFDFDRYQIREDARAILSDNAAILNGKVFKKVIIEGHCDERGTTDYNLALGERRAESTRRYLVSLGVDPSKISTISYGKEKPFCMGHNEDCWQQNRRAHFVVID